MDRVPCADLNGPALDLFLDQEATSEAGNAGIEQVHRGQRVVLVEVVMNISLKNVIKLLLQLLEVT